MTPEKKAAKRQRKLLRKMLEKKALRHLNKRMGMFSRPAQVDAGVRALVDQFLAQARNPQTCPIPQSQTQ